MPRNHTFAEGPSLQGLHLAGVIVLAWTAVALVYATQGYLLSLYRGTPQPWWSSLGYAAAIFSIWILLTGPIVWSTIRWNARDVGQAKAVALLAVGAVVVCTVHVFAFAWIYWPIYNGGEIATRQLMAERMLVRNLGTNTLFYFLVVGATILWRRRAERQRPGPTRAPAPQALAPLRARVRGSTRLIPLHQVEWIGSAGDYAEVHEGNNIVLIDESLQALSERLPADFARIHRQTIVRLDRIREIRRKGRGDAEVVLANGAILRLSRRYRANLPPQILGQARSEPDPA